MVRKDHYDQIDNSNNQYAKLKILFPTHDFDFVFTPLRFLEKMEKLNFLPYILQYTHTHFSFFIRKFIA